MTALGLDRKAFLGLGRQNPNDENEPFGMTVLALKLANVANGVSQLHGGVSRKMWQGTLAGPARSGGADHLDHQRRPHAQLAVAGHCPDLRPLSRHPVGRTADRARASGSGSSRSPTPSCGGRTSGAASGWSRSPAAG